MEKAKPREKDFDCVEFQHRAGAEVAKMLEGMTEDEQTAFWHERFLAMKKRQAERRRAAKTA
jgi:hypothetical protein